MRIRTSFALIPLLAIGAMAQTRSATPALYRIHRLTLVSSDLPRAERQSVVRTFQGGTYNLDELADRVRLKLRDSGYALVEVGDPQIIGVHSGRSACLADVRYSVHTGDQYRLGEITLAGGTVFPSAQLRAQFRIKDGDIFNATAIGKGLENLKDLYSNAGYPDFGAIPAPLYDNAHHTVLLRIEMDQGLSFNFGKLLFEGIEPRAGIANDLLASWKDMQNKRYNPQLLKSWLTATASEWPQGTLERAHTDYRQSPDLRLVNVLLHFQ